MQTTPYKPSRISLVFDADDTHLRFKVVVRPDIPMSDQEREIIKAPLENYAFEQMIPKELREAPPKVLKAYKSALSDSLFHQIDNIIESGETGEFELTLAKEVHNES